MVNLLGSILSLEKRQKPLQPLQILSIKDFLLPASLDGVGIFRIGAKLAAIEAIGRVFPSRPRINYQMAERTAHIDLLFFSFITLGSVVSSCYADDCSRELRPTTTLKRAAGAAERLSARLITNRNDSAAKSLLRSVRKTRHGNIRHGTRIIALASRHSVADHTSGLVARRAARLIVRVRRSIAQKI
jgi:hypothetical protein